MKGFGDAKPRGGNSPRMGDLVPVIDWPEDEYTHVRVVGPVYAYCHLWFNIATKMKPAPKGTSIPKLCLDLDGATDEFVTDHCPYRKSGKGRESKFYAVNVIVRDLQENGNFGKPKNIEASKHLGYKAYWGTKADAKKTPVRVLIVSENAAQKIQNLRKLNKVKDKKSGDVKTYDVSDPDYGCDIGIMINSKAKGAAKVEVQKGDRSPLTDEEKRYIMFPLDLLKPARLDEAKRDMADLMDRIINSKSDDKPGKSKDKKRHQDDDDDDVAGLSDDDLDVDDDDDDAPKKSKNKSKDKGKSKKSRDDDDDDDDDIDIDADLDDDDDDDEPKKKKSKDKGKSKKRSRDDDDDDDDDSSDDDDDDSDDDDDDSSDDDDDDDDEPKKSKSKNKGKSKKRSRDDDDDDDDSSDDDDDDDSSDDDDDDSSDDDDDDEDERPAKKNKSKSKKSSKKRR